MCVHTWLSTLSESKLGVGIGVELSWKTAVEQSTSRSLGVTGIWEAPAMRRGEVLLIALQKVWLKPQT